MIPGNGYGYGRALASRGYGTGIVVTPAKHGGHHRRHRKFVEIDGELYEVNNIAEARMLLEIYGTREEKKLKPKIITKLVGVPDEDFGRKLAKPLAGLRKIQEPWDEDEDEEFILLHLMN